MRNARISSRVWCSFGKIGFPTGLLYYNVIQTSLLNDISIIFVTLVFITLHYLNYRRSLRYFQHLQAIIARLRTKLFFVKEL